MIEKLGENHRSMRKANLNNIPIKEDKMLELIEALRSIFEWLKSSIMFNVKSFSSVYFTVLVLGEGCIQLGVGPRGQVLVGLYTVFYLFENQPFRNNHTMEELSISNTTLTDWAACNLACALQNNIRLERINLESNNVTPSTLVKIFEVRNI